MDQESTNQSSAKNITGIIIAVIITAIVVGGGVYLWQQSTIDNLNQNTNKAVENKNRSSNTNSLQKSKEVVGPAGDLIVEIREYTESTVLKLSTARDYADGCYSLECEIEKNDQKISFTIGNVLHRTEGICTMSPEPVACAMNLDLEDGSYDLEIKKGSRVDTYTIKAADKQYTLEANQTSFSEPYIITR